jgi:F0F1-type ATP synthase membrane subunit b/b'
MLYLLLGLAAVAICGWFLLPTKNESVQEIVQEIEDVIDETLDKVEEEIEDLEAELKALKKKTKKDLEQIARDKFGLELDRRLSKDNMIEQLREKLGG